MISPLLSCHKHSTKASIKHVVPKNTKLARPQTLNGRPEIIALARSEKEKLMHFGRVLLSWRGASHCRYHITSRLRHENVVWLQHKLLKSNPWRGVRIPIVYFCNTTKLLVSVVSSG